MIYLDSSALVKLVIAERESAGLRRHLQGSPDVCSCAIARVEVIRAARPYGTAAVTRARQLLRRINLLHIDDDLLDVAAALDPGVLRSLDAIHLAAALAIGDELTAVVTYDDRMAAGAEVLGLPVLAPS